MVQLTVIQYSVSFFLYLGLNSQSIHSRSISLYKNHFSYVFRNLKLVSVYRNRRSIIQNQHIKVIYRFPSQITLKPFFKIYFSISFYFIKSSFLISSNLIDGFCSEFLRSYQKTLNQDLSNLLVLFFDGFQSVSCCVFDHKT